MLLFWIDRIHCVFAQNINITDISLTFTVTVSESKLAVSAMVYKNVNKDNGSFSYSKYISILFY